MTRTSRADFSCAAATNGSAYRRVTVPVLRIEAGAGPAVLLMAGVHGDEWEGQAALLELWHALPGLLRRGTVYVAPAANAEASLAGTRLSPADGGNLNRAFLGAPARGYTEAVAHALQTRILPQVQYMIDVHSGGASLRYLPATVITRYGDDPWDERVARLARGFGLARCLFFRGVETGSMPAAASRLGVARLSAEIGGGAETSQELVRLCRDGMLSCLAGLDMVDAHHAMPGPLEAFHDVDAPRASMRADAPGVFIPSVALGQQVAAGQQVGTLCEPARPDRPPLALASPQDGTVVCLRALARSDDGDCLLQIAPARPFETLSTLY
ncbi:succinylglutamate desuccinylase [Bordetella bronchiseptica]|uniref:succinylglutamate desuccinylase n=1 Tax=Bordetella bronchiseptica TaxID=518 RepID=UPI00404AA75C